MSSIQSEYFTKALFTLLDETFDNIHGFYLDRNASLFETLANITADEASIPVGGKHIIQFAVFTFRSSHDCIYCALLRPPSSTIISPSLSSAPMMGYDQVAAFNRIKL